MVYEDHKDKYYFGRVEINLCSIADNIIMAIDNDLDDNRPECEFIGKPQQLRAYAIEVQCKLNESLFDGCGVWDLDEWFNAIFLSLKVSEEWEQIEHLFVERKCV